jgi:hypothetical protein
MLTKREEKRLLVFESKVFCTIYGPKVVDGVYRSRNNFELNRGINSPNFIGVVESYAGHMIRGAEDTPESPVWLKSRRNQGRWVEI